MNKLDGTPLMYLETIFFGIAMFVAIYFLVIMSVMLYRTNLLCCEKTQIHFLKIAYRFSSSKFGILKRLAFKKLKLLVSFIKKAYITVVFPRLKILRKKIMKIISDIKSKVDDKLKKK